MRIFGIAAIVVGVCCAIYFFMFFDASVAVPGVDMRVNNMGLLQDKQNGMIFGIGAAVVGSVLLAFGTAKPKEIIVSSNSRKCPFCAEIIKEEATICRYCGKDLPFLEKPFDNTVAHAHLSETEKPTNFIQNLAIDSQNRLRCPLCKSGIRLDDEEMSEKQFKCTSCKVIIGFTPKAHNGNAWT